MVKRACLSVVDCRFEPRSDQTKDYKSGISPQDFYSDSSLKQQSADRHVAQLAHYIIIILSQPVFALSS
jgi:hypothetical protein